MKIKVLKQEQNNLLVEVGNLTVTELVREYLNKDSSVVFAAWKREHPSKNPVLEIETKGKAAKKAFQDAVSLIEKDLDKFLADFKKAK